MRELVARGFGAETDTKVCPLHLLTGEYDFSRMPEDTKRTAAEIPGARVTIREGLGRFPMREAQNNFAAPVFREIVQTSSPSSKQGAHV